MKKVFSTIFLAALLLSIVIPRQARASDDVQYIIIKTATQAVAVPLAERPVITYTNNQLVVTTAEKQVEVPVAEIVSYTFTEEVPMAIRDVKVSAQRKQGMVAFNHLKAGAHVALFNAKGEQVRTTTAQADGTAVVDMHGLAKGVYIVRAEQLSIKIVNSSF